MRVDVVSIFPAYLAPLGLSLLGKAREQGLLDVRVHDLRDFTHDRHRSVDDTPYGGGAGMVMRPEPWGAALDSVAAAAEGATPHLVVPGPGGMPFSQAMARELAAEEWLVFACGRYEGIDERVYEDAARRMPVSVVSLGDYVVGGGEVAVLVIVEAVARLLPGVLGNAASLAEESHEDGLLEYPVYTKPPRWRGLEVPPVLLSGDHGAIREWRHEQRLRRTAARRPDLLHPSQALGAGGLGIALAKPSDAPELLTLQRACWATEAHAPTAPDLAELVEDVHAVRQGLLEWRTWVVRHGGRLVASVRGRVAPDDPQTWQIDRLMVAPDLQARGIGRALLGFAERAAAEGTTLCRLTTYRDGRAARVMQKAGYRPQPGADGLAATVDLVKRRHP